MASKRNRPKLREKAEAIDPKTAPPAHKALDEDAEAGPSAMRDRSHAAVELKLGPVALRAETDITPTGLLAVGGLVSGILLSVAAVVWVSTRKLQDDLTPRDLRKR